jgi:hypothetical protein
MPQQLGHLQNLPQHLWLTGLDLPYRLTRNDEIEGVKGK